MLQKSFQQIKKLQPARPSRLNEISSRFGRRKQDDVVKDSESDLVAEKLKSNEIKIVSAIDCKPVQPTYLKLIPFPQYIKLTKALKHSQQSGQSSGKNQESNSGLK